MAALKALTLAGAAVIAVATGASAADLLPPPPPLEPYAPIAADFSGWYLRGDVGIGVEAGTLDLKNTPDPLPGYYSYAATQAFNNTTLSESGEFDVGVGYQFNRWLRGDLTLEYRGGATLQSLYTLTDSVSTQQYADFYRADVSSIIGLANVYADIGTWYGITPFVGAGIGFAHNMVSGFTDQGFAYPGNGNGYPSGGYFSNGSQNQFAWALMAGLDYDVTSNLKLELGYRYLNYGKLTTGGSNCLTGGAGGTFNNVTNCNGGVANYVSSTTNLASNDFRLGFIWLLGDQTPPPPGPIVRKY